MEPCVFEYLNYCKYQRKLDSKTLKAYSLDLRHFSTFQKASNTIQYLKDVDKNLIGRYLQHLNSYSPNTIRRKVASLKAFFSYLEFEDKIIVSPFKKMKLKLRPPNKMRRILSIQNLNVILTNAYSAYDNNGSVYAQICAQRDIVILELLINTGIRVSELCNIKVNDFNSSFSYVKINGKGNKERIMPLPNNDLKISLMKYNSLRIESEYYFMNRLGRKITSQSIRNVVLKHSKGLNSQKITPHMFRHSFATLLLEQDTDIRFIQQLLGHSTITTTEIYTQVSNKKTTEILTRKNPRDLLEVLYVNTG